MKRCLICQCELSAHQSLTQWLFSQDPLCQSCRAQLIEIKQTIVVSGLHIHVCCRYDEFMENLLFQFKEGRDVALAPILFSPYIQWMKHFRRRWVLMPSSHEKCMERGFFSLREMLRDSDEPLFEPLYKKSAFKQSQRSKAQRMQVIDEIFLKQEYPLPQGDLLLVDDVCTTAATLLRAYQLLKPHSNTIEAVVLCAHPLLLAQKETTLHRFQRRGRSWKEQ